jgi:hypothetical protein
MIQDTINTYPTREEILGQEENIESNIIQKVLEWKKETWLPEKQKENPEIRFELLEKLIEKLNQETNHQITMTYKPEMPSACYIPIIDTICMNKSLSIISTLHEYAHALFGPEEAKACKWSVWLFIQTFPKSFQKLEWNGHCLIKRNN